MGPAQCRAAEMAVAKDGRPRHMGEAKNSSQAAFVIGDWRGSSEARNAACESKQHS